MKNRLFRTAVCGATITVVGLILTSCPNPISDQIAEDVLVEQAGGRPEISGQIPAPGATNVPSSTSIEVEFNMPLAPDAIDHLRITAGKANPQPVDGTPTYDSDTKTLVFQPAAPLTVGSRYTVTVLEGLKNSGGARLENEVSWGFDTTLVNPDQFRFDIDMSKLDIDLSTYRTYLSVQRESAVSDSPLGGTIYGGEFGGQSSFLVDPESIGANSSEGLFVSLLLLQTEIVSVDPSENEGFSYALQDEMANMLVWTGYQGSTGTLYPSFSQIDGESISYGSGGLPRGHSEADAGSITGFDHTLTADLFLQRGVVHTLSPEDAFLTLDYQEIQSLAITVALDEEERIEVDSRYGFSVAAFTTATDGDYAITYYSDTVDNRDTYSQLMLFKRTADRYSIVERGGDTAISTESVPTFNPYDEGGQFDYVTWQVDVDGTVGDDQDLVLVASSEYLIVVDSWLHVPGTRSGQIDSGAYRISIDSTPP